MRRIALVFSLVIAAFSAVAQTSPQVTTSDALAVSLAQQSIAAVTGSAAISDVTLKANIISIIGPDSETGTGIFRAKGIGESRVDLTLSDWSRSDVRNIANGVPAGAWEMNGNASISYAEHNCLTDAVWFFPGFSSLMQTANPNFIFKYIGQQQHGGVTVQHVVVFQLLSRDPSGALQRLSSIDFYLDTNSKLPLAVSSSTHADNDMNTNIPNEIRFANYQSVNGVQVPFHLQRIFNGNVVLDVQVTNATFNTGLQDTVFSLQ